MTRWDTPAVVGIAAALTMALVTGCSANDSNGDSASAELRVGAATSLRDALTTYSRDSGFPILLSSASSDEIATQILAGADLDVFVSVDPDLVNNLEADGLVSGSRQLGENELVIAVASDSGVESVEQLAQGSFALGTGTPGTPFGRYAEALFDRLPSQLASALRRNVRTREPNLTSLIGKLRQGSIEAAVIYRSDVEASEGALRFLQAPPGIEQLRVPVIGTVVARSERQSRAVRFLDGLETKSGRAALRRSGFEASTGDSP